VTSKDLRAGRSEKVYKSLASLLSTKHSIHSSLTHHFYHPQANPNLQPTSPTTATTITRKFTTSLLSNLALAGTLTSALATTEPRQTDSFKIRLGRPTYFGHTPSKYEDQYLHIAKGDITTLVANPSADDAAVAFFQGDTLQVVDGEGMDGFVIQLSTGIVTLFAGAAGTGGLGIDIAGQEQPGIWSTDVAFQSWYMCK
jgi:hypothetical protein